MKQAAQMPSISINGHDIENMQSFEYLGCDMSDDAMMILTSNTVLMLDRRDFHRYSTSGATTASNPRPRSTCTKLQSVQHWSMAVRPEHYRQPR